MKYKQLPIIKGELEMMKEIKAEIWKPRFIILNNLERR